MMVVAYTITAGSTTFSSQRDRSLRKIDVHASMKVPANLCLVQLSYAQDISASVGDAFTVALGDSQQETQVFSGVIVAINFALEHVTIEAASIFDRLLHHSANLVHEQSSAGDIVTALLGSQQIPTASIEDGNSFTSYRVDQRRNLWQACQQLAIYAGFDFYANHNDEAEFKAFNAAEQHDIHYGVNLLNFNVHQSTPIAESIQVSGESPVGQGESNDASSWLTKKDVQGAAGGSASTLRYKIPVATNKDMAMSMAEAIFTPAKIKTTGSVTCIGLSQAKLGDALNFVDLPHGQIRGEAKIVDIHHRLDQQRGYISRFHWEQVE